MMIGARPGENRYDTIDSRYSLSLKAVLFVLLQCNIYLMQENSLPGIVLILIVCNLDLKLFFCLRSIRINIVLSMQYFTVTFW